MRFLYFTIFMFTVLTQPMTYSHPDFESIPHAHESSIKNIIFDLDGVLLKTDSFKAFQQIGLGASVQYMLYNRSLPSQERLFEILYNVDDCAVSKQPAYNQGMRLPQIMVDWQCNLQSLKEIEECMKFALYRSNVNNTEQIVFERIIQLMTNSEKLVNCRAIIPHGLELLRQFKLKGYNTYILSNWSADSWDLLQEKFPEIFDDGLLDGTMISGHIQKLKPDSEVFDVFINTFNINPKESLFIDDTIENIISSVQYGIPAIHCNPKNFTQNIKLILEELTP